MSTASPSTVIPRTSRVSLNACTKKRVGLPTAAARTIGEAPTGIRPLTTSAARPGGRRSRMSAVRSAPTVRTSLRSVRPEPASRKRARAGRPTAGAGSTTTSTTFSRCCSAPAGAANPRERSSQAHPLPRPGVSRAPSSRRSSSPTTRPAMRRTPSALRSSAQRRKALPAPGALMVGSPAPRTTRSPCNVPSRIGAAASNAVSKRLSQPSRSAAAARVTSFIVEAGVSSTSGFRA